MYQGISSCKREIVKMISRSAVFMAAMLIFFILGYNNILTVRSDDFFFHITQDVTYTQSELNVILSAEDILGIKTDGHILRLTGSVVCPGSLYINSGGEVIAEGNLNIAAPVIIEEGGKLTVKGDYVQSADGFGDFAPNASVYIDGNATFSGTGHPNNTSFEATVTVSGNLIYDSTSDCEKNCCKWVVNGDVIQKEKADGGHFDAHKLVMTGEGKKKLELQENGNVGELSLENGMTLDVPAYFACDMIKSDMTINTEEYTVFTAINIDEGLQVTVDGDMFALCEYGFAIFDGASLKVTGDYTQNLGALGDICEGVSVEVDGNVSFTGTGIPGTTSVDAMITVGKDLIFNSSSAVDKNYCTWIVKGDVIQKEKADGGHFYVDKLVMTGEGKKKLELQENGNVGELSLENGMALDVPGNFACDMIKSDMTINTEEYTVFTAINIDEGLQVTVDGDMFALCEYGFAIFDGAALKVTGDYTQNLGALGDICEGVSVEVDGNVSFTGTGIPGTTSTDATITVGKDLIFNSSSSVDKNYCKWIVKGKVIQEEKENMGELYFNKLMMPTKDSEVRITKGKISLLTLAYGKSHYTIIPDTCYEKLIATGVVTLDANGGTVEPGTVTATTEAAYGSLPVPVLDGKEFAGWYTAKDDGDVITATTVVTAVDDHTLYAHWKDKAEEGQPDTDPEPTPTPEPEKPDTETEVTVSDNKVSKINNADVGIEVIISYPKAVTWTGKKITKGQLAVLSKDGTIATVKISGLENAISSLKTDVDLGKLIMPTYVIGSEKKVNSKGSFYVKLGLNSGVAKKAGIKGKDKTALSKIIKELNKELKAKRCSFDIVPIELKDAVSVNIKANIKSGELVLNDDGSIKGLKSVKIKVRIPGIEKEKIYSFTAKKALKTFKISVTDKAAKQATLEALEGQNFKGSYSGIEITK